jgi:very-short-patch-repair endonuclease
VRRPSTTLSFIDASHVFRERRFRRNIPVTSPALTLVDIAPRLGTGGLETALGKADSKNIVKVGAVRAFTAKHPRLPGAKLVRETLDRRTFRVTETELEKEFLRLMRSAALPLPRTQIVKGTARVDFIWPELGLVIEVDGLRYHRTAIQQSADAKRDHAHQLAGRTPMRFSHAQVFFEPAYVVETVTEMIGRLA